MEDTKKEEPLHIFYDFHCSACGIYEKAHYKGISPPFSRNIELKYPSYVMKDPFSPPGKGEILVLGADCSLCDKTVCINRECSLFFHKTYCLDCVHKNVDKFPAEVKIRISKKQKQ